jgi:hypothetical protein
MHLARFSTLLLATLMASPALYHAFVTHDLEPTTALIRFLIAVPVAAIMLAVVRVVTSGYQRNKRNTEPIHADVVTGTPLPPARRADD